jgi:hypothetical protein
MLLINLRTVLLAKYSLINRQKKYSQVKRRIKTSAKYNIDSRISYLFTKYYPRAFFLINLDHQFFVRYDQFSESEKMNMLSMSIKTNKKCNS